MKKRTVFLWSLTVALAGFLFGFDTVVISGADGYLEKFWPRGAAFHGFVVMSSALWGTVVGALLGGIPTDKLGRKTTLLWIGVFFAASAIGSALANDPWFFAAFRFLGGLGVGASTIAAPAYIAEISPAKDRGKLVAMYQFNIVFGILVAFLSNYLLSDMGENTWRWMLGVEAIPAVLYTLMMLVVPRSPRWLLTAKHDETEARRVLAMVNEPAEVERLISEMRDAETKADTSETIFIKKYRFPLILAFLIAFFNQVSGINAFLYYAPRIFELAGLGQSTALLSSIGVGATNLVFTLVGLALIDRLGRRQLMYVGSVGYIVSLSLVAYAFAAGWTGMVIPLLLFLFIASHAVGQGAVIWVFISEIFPNHLRAGGQAFGSSTHWLLAAIIPSVVPLLFDTIGAAPVFAFFAFMMVLQLIFVWRMMPETKGVPLEELQEKLTKGWELNKT